MSAWTPQKDPGQGLNDSEDEKHHMSTLKKRHNQTGSNSKCGSENPPKISSTTAHVKKDSNFTTIEEKDEKNIDSSTQNGSGTIDPETKPAMGRTPDGTGMNK